MHDFSSAALIVIGGCEVFLSLSSGRDTVQEFMWQEGLSSVAEFISECLDKVYAPAAGPYDDGQASNEPDVAGRDVI